MKIKDKSILPKGFTLHSFLVFQDIGLSCGANKIIKPDDFNVYLNEPHCDIDCQLLAKKYLGLPKFPKGYYFSLVITLLLSRDDFKRLQGLYPQKYNLDPSKDSDQELLAGTYILKTQTEILKYNLRHFNPSKYKAPILASIRSRKCGCYINDVTVDANEIKGWDEHVYTFGFDNDYNKIFSNIPVRFNALTRIDEFFRSIIDQVNEYSGSKMLSSSELIEIAKFFIYNNYLSKKNGLSVDLIKKTFNPKIDQYTNNNTVENDFYMQYFVDYLDRLEENGILKRCKCCNKGFDYHHTREHCSDKCAKSLRNANYYERHRDELVKKSRIEMRDTRKVMKALLLKDAKKKEEERAKKS